MIGEELAVQHHVIVLTHLWYLGLSLNHKKSVLTLSQRTTFLDIVSDSTTMWAQMSQTQIESVLAMVGS